MDTFDEVSMHGRRKAVFLCRHSGIHQSDPVDRLRSEQHMNMRTGLSFLVPLTRRRDALRAICAQVPGRSSTVSNQKHIHYRSGFALDDLTPMVTPARDQGGVASTLMAST
jgi:hypothetical protein